MLTVLPLFRRLRLASNAVANGCGRVRRGRLLRVNVGLYLASMPRPARTFENPGVARFTRSVVAINDCDAVLLKGQRLARREIIDPVHIRNGQQ